MASWTRPACPALPPRLRVLLAESDAMLRLATAAMLAALGHDVLEAGTAAEALAGLIRGVDLVICGYRLPEMDDLSLVDQIRKRLPGVPAIVARRSARGEAHGVVWLGKPYDATAVMEALPACASAA